MRVRLLLVAAVAAVLACAAAAHGAVTVAIFTIAGGDSDGFKGDGKVATAAALNGPSGVVVAPDGTIFLADTINQRIRRIDPSGRIATIAGSGKRGFAGDGGPATKASLQDPTALALAKDGSLFFADTGNSRVRVVRPNGTIATIAGTADQGFSGDGGPAAAAQVKAPAGLALAQDGSLFVADTGNSRVRQVRVDGSIVAVAGNGSAGSGGDGGPATSAQRNAPAGLAVASDGSLLIADSGNNRILRVAPSGGISTVAAQLNFPLDVAAIPAGGFFVAEAGGNDHRIRYVAIPGQSSRLAFAPLKASVLAPLHEVTVTVRQRKRRVRVVANTAIAYAVTKDARVIVRIATKRGTRITTLQVAAKAGRNVLHLPKTLRSGKRRLAKDHYVLRMTAAAGLESATASLELVVK